MLMDSDSNQSMGSGSVTRSPLATCAAPCVHAGCQPLRHHGRRAWGISRHRADPWSWQHTRHVQSGPTRAGPGDRTAAVCDHQPAGQCHGVCLGWCAVWCWRVQVGAWVCEGLSCVDSCVRVRAREKGGTGTAKGGTSTASAALPTWRHGARRVVNELSPTSHLWMGAPLLSAVEMQPSFHRRQLHPTNYFNWACTVVQPPGGCSSSACQPLPACRFCLHRMQVCVYTDGVLRLACSIRHERWPAQSSRSRSS
jgi:hypothetical protein